MSVSVNDHKPGNTRRAQRLLLDGGGWISLARLSTGGCALQLWDTGRDESLSFLHLSPGDVARVQELLRGNTRPDLATVFRTACQLSLDDQRDMLVALREHVASLAKAVGG